MKEEDVAVLDINKTFEVYDILWLIDDFSLATCSKNWLIESPEFTVRGLHTTKWLLYLTTTSDIRYDFMEFTLKRSDSDTGPERMFAEWRLGISLSHSEEYFVGKGCGFFVKGTEHKQNIKSLKNSVGTVESFESDLMTIQGRMIIFKDISPEEFELINNNNNDRGKRCLSEDLLNLFMHSYGYDLNLKIGNERILAHKAIVFARIKELDRLLEQANRLTDSNVRKNICEVDLSILNYGGMMSVMKYIYSGDPWHVLGKPSLSIYDCVSYLEIWHLMKYYTKKKLTFRTSMNAREVIFTWTITDFHENYRDSVISPVFSDDCSTTWRFRFFPSGERNYFSIFADIVRETRIKCICLEFAVTDRSGDTLFARRLRSATDELKSFGFDKFIRRSILRTYSPDNILRLTIKLKLSTGSMRSCAENYEISVVKSSLEINSLDLLSINMQKLLQESDFSDALIRNDNDEGFLVHECITAWRCRFLSKLSNAKDGSRAVMTIPNIESNVLYILLTYLYTGVLPETVNRDKFTELREVALSLGLPLLVDLCSDALREEEASLGAITADERYERT